MAGRRDIQLTRDAQRSLRPLIPAEAPLEVPDHPARRELGAYYTPSVLAQLLVDWALAGQGRRLLDPSAGGGVFLDATLTAIADRRDDRRVEVYGIEIDNQVAQLLRDRFGAALKPDHIFGGDFFSYTARELGKFGAIVGNPPYIRHHELAESTRQLARRRAAEADVPLNDLADAWAYFVVHALSLLEPGGRLALVLPASVLHAGYARPVLEAVAALPGEAELTRVQTLLFDGVQERTVLLTADTDADDAPLAYREIEDIAGLQDVLSPRAGVRAPLPAREFIALREDRLLDLLPAATRKAWSDVLADAAVASLGSVARIRIGVVTGANAFFVRTPHEIDALTLGSDRAHDFSIISRSGWLTGLRWTREDVDAHNANPSRLLVLSRDHVPNDKLAAALSDAVELDIPRRSHCAKREPWWALTDFDVPELFLPYMGGHTPRLVVNEAGSLCTNAVHRLKIALPQVHPFSLALSSWTSLYRLSAELAGRQYAGGVLKFEIGEAARLRIIDIDLGPRMSRRPSR